MQDESNGNISELLSYALSNPELLKSAMSAAKELASGIKSGEASDKAPTTAPPAPRPPEARERQSEACDNRVKLMNALKPYLGDERRQRADQIISIMKLIDLSESSGLLKNLLGGGFGNV